MNLVSFSSISEAKHDCIRCLWANCKQILSEKGVTDCKIHKPVIYSAMYSTTGFETFRYSYKSPSFQRLTNGIHRKAHIWHMYFIQLLFLSFIEFLLYFVIFYSIQHIHISYAGNSLYSQTKITNIHCLLAWCTIT